MTPWAITHPAPLSMGFPRQGYWSGLPFPFPGNLTDPGVEPGSPTLQADSSLIEPPGKPQKMCIRLLNQNGQKAFDYLSTVDWLGTPLTVQWLRFHIPNAGGIGSIPGPISKIPHAT